MFKFAIITIAVFLASALAAEGAIRGSGRVGDEPPAQGQSR